MMMANDRQYVNEDCIAVYAIAKGYLIVTRTRLLLLEVYPNRQQMVEVRSEIVLDDCLSLRTISEEMNELNATTNQLSAGQDFTVKGDNGEHKQSLPSQSRHYDSSHQQREGEGEGEGEDNDNDNNAYFIEFVTLLPFDFFDRASNSAGQLFGCRFQTQRVLIGHGKAGKQVCKTLEEILQNERDNHNYGRNETSCIMYSMEIGILDEYDLRVKEKLGMKLIFVLY